MFDLQKKIRSEQSQPQIFVLIFQANKSHQPKICLPTWTCHPILVLPSAKARTKYPAFSPDLPPQTIPPPLPIPETNLAPLPSQRLLDRPAHGHKLHEIQTPKQPYFHPDHPSPNLIYFDQNNRLDRVRGTWTRRYSVDEQPGAPSGPETSQGAVERAREK